MRLLLVYLLLCLLPYAYAQDPQLVTEAETLKGIRGFKVIVLPVSETSRTLGITDSDIQTAVELRLRSLGLPVSRYYYKADALLFIRKDTVCITEHLMCATHFRLELNQSVLLFADRKAFTRTATHTMAPTYTQGVTTLYGTKALKEKWKETLLQIVDEFSSDFLEQNPKK